MTKKISKIIAIVFMTVFIMGITKGSYAKSINSLSALGKDIEAINPNAESAYVIGNYVFTSSHDLEIQDIMLSARTISVKDTNGKTNKDAIYGEMTIYTLKRQYDANMKPTGWKVIDNLVGNSKLEISNSKPININYIDYKYLKETYTVTFNYGYNNKTTTKPVLEGNTVEAPKDTTRAGYKFDGWYLNGQKYNFSNKVTGNITLTAKWIKIVDVDSYVETAAKTINTSNKFEAIVEGDKVTVVVKNATAGDSITEGGSMAFVALTEMMNNDKNIASVTMELTGYNEKLTLKNGADYYAQVVAWLNTYLPTIGKTLEDATNSDLVGKTVKVTVTTTDNAVVDGTTSKTAEYEISFKTEKNVSNMVSKVETALENSNKYNVTVVDHNITVEVKAEERNKLAIGGTNAIVALGELLADENVDHIVLALGNETKDISNAETAKNDILVWLATTSIFKNKDVSSMKNEDLYDLVKNADLSVAVVLKDAMSENGKAEEKYTVTIKLEDYVQVPVAEYVNDAADLIKGSGKFEVKVDENKNVKVTVNNTSANDPIIGGTQVIFALTEMFNEGTIASMTLTIDGYDDADPLTINKDDNYFDVIKTYLETYLKTKKPSLTIETAKLQDIIGTKFSVKVKLTEDAKVKGSDDKLDEETYNVEIRKQPEQKNVASMVDSVKKVLEGTHDEGKYTVKVEGNKVDVKVKAENREDKVIGGTDIIVALGKLLNEDNKVDHITLNYCGCDIEIKNAATAKNEIIAWVIENKDKMFKAGTFDSLTAETITNLTNEKVYGMLKDTAAAATITVALKEDFVSENKNEQETYTITFELEDYTIVKEQEVISNLTSKLETAGKFVAIVDEENPQNVTVAVKADFINESVLSTGTGVILALTEMFNNNVASLTLTYNGADVEQTLEIKKDTNYVETITQWLNRNQLNDLKNSQFAGKTITVKATLTPDARTEAGEKETKEYTITIKLLADIRAMQENAIGKKEGINDPTKGKVQVNIEENIVKVKMLSPTTKLSELTSHTGANVTLTEFMNTPGIKSFTIIVGETKTDEPSPNYVTVEKSSDYTPYAAQLAFKLMSSVPDPSVASEQDLVDMKTTIKVQIELDDDYVLAPDSYLEYTLDFVV